MIVGTVEVEDRRVLKGVFADPVHKVANGDFPARCVSVFH
jgi:hypothetical protein